MEVLRAIKKRRSIRKFKSDSIDKNIIENILNCGRLAPSAKNRQPWKFVAITNKDVINKIADIMIDSKSKEDIFYTKTKLKVNNSTVATAKIMKQAPVLILIFKEIQPDWETGDTLSLGACIENMCLRATELKLGSLWIRDTVYSQKLITKFLEFDTDKIELNSALSIGVANENPVARLRYKLEDITTWIE